MSDDVEEEIADEPLGDPSVEELASFKQLPFDVESETESLMSMVSGSRYADDSDVTLGDLAKRPSKTTREKTVQKSVDTLGKFTLWNTLREFLKETGDESASRGDKLAQLATQYMSPVETHCLVRQTNECTDVKRLDILMNLVGAGVNAEEEKITLFEILDLMHDKTAKYHSSIGSIYGTFPTLLRMKSKAKNAQVIEKWEDKIEKKKENISRLNDQYVKDVMVIVNWLLDPENLDYLYPFEKFPPQVRKGITDLYSPEENQEEFDRFWKYIRNKTIRKRIGYLIDLDLDDVIQGANNLSGAAIINYVQNQKVKAKKNWGHRRYVEECKNMYLLMYQMIRVRDVLEGLNTTEDDARRLYIKEQTKIAKIFEAYYNRGNEILKFLLLTKLIPSPVAVSTYPVYDESKDVDVFNMLMWPDRVLQTAGIDRQP